MSLPIDAFQLFQVVGMAVLVYLVARARPVTMQNGGMVKSLMEQYSQAQQRVRELEELLAKTERIAQERERDCAMYRQTIRRLNEDCDRHRQS